MVISALVFLFLIGSVASAMQAMKWLERRQQRDHPKPPTDQSTGQ